jgi:hypothetical protein
MATMALPLTPGVDPKGDYEALERSIDGILAKEWDQQVECVKGLCAAGSRNWERNWVARIAARDRTGFGKKTFPIFAMQQGMPQGRQVVLWGLRARLALAGVEDGPENRLEPVDETQVFNQAFFTAAVQGWVSVLRLLQDGSSEGCLGGWTPPVIVAIDVAIATDQLRSFRYLFARTNSAWRNANWDMAANKAAEAGSVAVMGWVLRSRLFVPVFARVAMERALKKCASDRACYCDCRRQIANMILGRFGGALGFLDDAPLRGRYEQLRDRKPGECV